MRPILTATSNTCAPNAAVLTGSVPVARTDALNRIESEAARCNGMVGYQSGDTVYDGKKHAGKPAFVNTFFPKGKRWFLFLFLPSLATRSAFGVIFWSYLNAAHQRVTKHYGIALR